MPTESTSETELVSQILVLVGRDPAAILQPGTPSEDLFRAATRKQLLDCAQRLGLAGVSKLGKDDLVGRVRTAFESLLRPAIPVVPPVSKENGNGSGNGHDTLLARNGGGGTFAKKFDLGPDTEPAEEVIPSNIPWGYGHNRVTAMVVDPDRLFVYWEVTDDGVASARAGLGSGGEGAWLNLRVYDITGRLFDGTNAHSYFDHRLERHDRQWFFSINKPTSAACVEVGLLSHEGYFIKIARSGRVEFPRKEPVGGGPVEWLSVRTASGPVGSAWTGSPPGPGGGAPAGAPGGGGPAGGAPGPGGPGGGAPATGEGWSESSEWSDASGFPLPGGQRLLGRRWQWQEASGTEWTSEMARSEWIGPVLRTAWEAGPFTYPVEAPTMVEYRDTGELSVRTEGGQVHVVYGPWQVVIRGIGARAERRVLSTWEYRRQIELVGGGERNVFVKGTLAPGSSEWLMAGASERSWQGSSELLMRGASELWLLGASELLLRGASETLLSGASEYRLRGSSERWAMGASERLFRGATERRLGGATETLFAGASEQRLGGASELYIGASERFAGASERHGGASERHVKASEPFVPTPGSPYPTPGQNRG